jgi:hypothetical protein
MRPGSIILSITRPSSVGKLMEMAKERFGANANRILGKAVVLYLHKSYF